MARSERRNSMTLDEVNQYWRRLKSREERPGLLKVCNAIHTLDTALDTEVSAHHLSRDIWSRIRNDYFEILVSSFTGYFSVYEENSVQAVAAVEAVEVEGWARWPSEGVLEFFPDNVNRRDDSYRASFRNIAPPILLRFRWCHAEGRHHTVYEDFQTLMEQANELVDEMESVQAGRFLEKLYDASVDEAFQAKKIAHRKWWQLYYESSACNNSKRKQELRRQMINLQTVWGRPR